MKNFNISAKYGFTLIELLIVVLIIGILAAIAFPQYQIAVEKSRMAEAVANVKVLAGAADRYVLATGNIPTSLEQLDITIPLQTKYFSYGTRTDIRRIYAHRLPLTKYYIYLDGSSSGKMNCFVDSYATPSDIQRTLCNNFSSQGI